MANIFRRSLLIYGVLFFSLPNFSNVNAARQNVKWEAFKKLNSFRKKLQIMTDWAEESGVAILNHQPIPLAPGGLRFTKDVLDEFINILDQAIATFRIPMPSLDHSDIYQPVGSESRRQIRSKLRNSTKAVLTDVGAVENAVDHIEDIRDWSGDVNEVAVALRQAAETLEHIYRFYPEYNGKLQIGITVLNLVETSEATIRRCNQASDLARELELELSKLREEIKTRKTRLLQSLRKEQSLLQADLEKFEREKLDLEERAKTKQQKDRQIEYFRRRISDEVRNERIFEETVEECDELIPGLNRDVERLRNNYRAEEIKANEPFNCPAGHMSPWVCVDNLYKSEWGQRVNSATKRRDDYKGDLDTKFSKLKTVEKKREEAAMRLANVKQRLSALRRDLSDRSSDSNRFDAKLARDTKQFWADAYENMASAHSQESKADETNLIQAL